ncbi:hypothetical protein D3Y55_25910 [Mesorhizobium sp. DCY119]|nr:hypothetical protein D3Y55_25910 [Mesorhizobium sp. DCY119]
MVFALALATTQIVGCLASQPEPNSVRNTGTTAPAEHQLACASAAAAPLGVDSSAILPVSSSQIDPQTFQVIVEGKGARATCVIDASGNVVSVQKV